MEYPFLTSLWIFKLILALLFGTATVYYLLKLLKQSTKFLIVLKGVVFYEICAVLVYLVYPKFYASRIFGGFYSAIIEGLILAAILFVIFYFITRKYFLVNIKKSLIIFFMMIFLSSLFLGIFEAIEHNKLSRIPPFVKDSIKLENQINQIISEQGFGRYITSDIRQYEPLSFRMIDNIETGAFIWYSQYIQTVLGNK